MIVNIQTLRGLAATMVVFYHAVGMTHHYDFKYKDIIGIGSWGQFGVDVFFVISGFIMSYMIDKKRQTSYAFFINRIKRIAPTYWLLTLIVIFIQQVFPSVVNNNPITLKQNTASILFSSVYFGYDYPTLYVGWTLECEMFFYFLFSISLLFKFTDIFRFFILSFFIFIFVYLEYIPPISLEFSYGILLFLFYKKNPFICNGWHVKTVLMTMFLASMSLVFFFKNIDEAVRPYIWGIAAFFLVFSSLYYEQLSTRFLLMLGRASYSIYLFQVFSLSFFFKLIKMFYPHMSGYIVVILTSLLTLFFGVIFYYTIEKKLSNVLKFTSK